jgi:hypothetical protein
MMPAGWGAPDVNKGVLIRNDGTNVAGGIKVVFLQFETLTF